MGSQLAFLRAHASKPAARFGVYHTHNRTVVFGFFNRIHGQTASSIGLGYEVPIGVCKLADTVTVFLPLSPSIHVPNYRSVVKIQGSISSAKEPFQRGVERATLLAFVIVVKAGFSSCEQTVIAQLCLRPRRSPKYLVGLVGIEGPNISADADNELPFNETHFGRDQRIFFKV